MSNEFQVHQDIQQFDILSFLQGHTYPALKLNNSFLFTNKRQIALLDNGMLVYYSKYLNNCYNDARNITTQPKYGVYFSQTKYSCVKVTEKQIELIVKFKECQLYSFNKEMISYVKEPKSQKQIIWIFTISLQCEQLVLQKSKKNSQLKLSQQSTVSFQTNQNKSLKETIEQ